MCKNYLESQNIPEKIAEFRLRMFKNRFGTTKITLEIVINFIVDKTYYTIT